MQAILKFVGKQHYPWPQDHINETRKRGPSIRIPPDSIPDLDTPYPVLFAHPRGTFLVTEKEMKLPDFFEECKREEHIIATPPENEYIQDGLPTLEFISTLQRLHDHDRAEYNRLVDKYGIEFHYAVTHYSWITRTQLVVGEDGEGLERAEDLEGMGLDFEIIQVIQVDGKE